MSDSLILIIFGSFLMLAATGLAYSLRPAIKIAGQEIGFAGEAKSGVLGGGLTVGVFIAGAAVAILGFTGVIDERARTVRSENRQAARETAAFTAPTDAPIPGENPASTSVSNVAQDLFHQAIDADDADNIEGAIRLYGEAIAAGLPEDDERIALVEIGFLELESDDGCDNAATALAAARSVPTSAHEDLITELDSEVAFFCGP